MFAPERIDDVSAASTEQLEERIVSLCRQVACQQAQLLVAVGEFDRREGWKAAGARSCSTWLAWATDLSQTAAREHVRVARALRSVPRLTEAFLRGELTLSKVRALTRVADEVDESLLLRWGHGRTAAEIESIVRDHRIARCSVDPAERRKHRSLAWRYADDGTLLITARLEPEEGAVVLNAIEVALREARRDRSSGASAEALADDRVAAPHLSRAQEAEARDEDDLEGSPPWQRERADALCRVAEGYLSGSGEPRRGPDRTLVVLHTSPAALARDTGTATIDGGPPIDISTARRLSCDASIVAVRDDTDGSPFVGRRSRIVPRAVRRRLRARDGHCRFPSCGTWREVDAHHIVHWSNGGPTILENLVLLCRHHHRAIHERGFAVEFIEPGEFVFRRPDGRVIERAALGETYAGSVHA